MYRVNLSNLVISIVLLVQNEDFWEKNDKIWAIEEHDFGLLKISRSNIDNRDFFSSIVSSELGKSASCSSMHAPFKKSQIIWSKAVLNIATMHGVVLSDFFSSAWFWSIS